MLYSFYFIIVFEVKKLLHVSVFGEQLLNTCERRSGVAADDDARESFFDIYSTDDPGVVHSYLEQCSGIYQILL